MDERRKGIRFKAIEGIRTEIRAEDSDKHTEGIVLNISHGGAYIFADSIPFQTGIVIFRINENRKIQRRCRRVYPHRPGARGQAVGFFEPLTDEELEALKAPVFV